MHRCAPLILTLLLVAAFASAAEQAPELVVQKVPQPLLQQVLQPPPVPPCTITVTGRAVGYIPADTVIWAITLESMGKDVSDVKQASDRLVKTLADACMRLGIQPADIDTGLIRMEDARIVGRTAPEDLKKPFTATRTVTIRQTDLGGFNDVLEMLSTQAIKRMRYVFVSSQRETVVRETIVEAARVATDKAAAMAAVAGAALGKPLLINEYAPPHLKIPEDAVPVDKDSPAFGADAEKIIATVYVTFELE